MFCLHGMSMFYPEVNIPEVNILGIGAYLERNLLLSAHHFFPSSVRCNDALKLQSTRTTVPTVMTMAFKVPTSFLKVHCRGKDGRMGLCPLPLYPGMSTLQ